MLAQLSALLFPAQCPGCGRAGEPLCDRCAHDLRPPDPAPPPRGVEGWAAPFAYEGVAREIVARLKYRQARAAIPWLAGHMTAAAVALPGPVDAVTWVPTTPARRRARGFDHAELLARAVACRLRRPVRRTLVRAPGPPQTGLPARARRAGPTLTVVARRVPARVAAGAGWSWR